METRVLILNPDPVFEDRLLSILDLTDWTETRVVRSLSEAVAILIAESFDGFIIEGEPESAVETATVARQHFPSLKLLCVPWERPSADSILNAQRQHIPLDLNQFSAADVLQMTCMVQRSGRFTFKSGRGNSEIYVHQGEVRHAVYGTLEGEGALAEIFRWRQGRFYFEEGIISQEQSVDRPLAHLLLDNLQKFDETLEVAAVTPMQ